MNAASQMTSVTDANGHVTSFTFDALGRQTRVTLPDPDGGGGLSAPYTDYEFDKNSNVTSVTIRRRCADEHRQATKHAGGRTAPRHSRHHSGSLRR